MTEPLLQRDFRSRPVDNALECQCFTNGNPLGHRQFLPCPAAQAQVVLDHLEW